jgi:hypothetical protein
MRLRLGISVALLVSTLAFAGCGGSSKQPSAAKQQKHVTFPAYGSFSATTVPVTTGSVALCRGNAEAFARDAVTFLKPSATPADQYFVSMRTQFIDFVAHRCDASILRSALTRRLDANERQTLIARLPFLGSTARELR